MRPLIDPRMLDALPQFFPDRVTVRAHTETQDAMGFPVTTWADVEGQVSLHARVGETSAQERQATDLAFASATHKCLLRGYYPSIDVRHRLVKDGIVYQITGNESNPERTLTRLRLRFVENQNLGFVAP